MTMPGDGEVWICELCRHEYDTQAEVDNCEALHDGQMVGSDTDLVAVPRGALRRLLVSHQDVDRFISLVIELDGPALTPAGAPPVAVDPEARRWTDDDLLAAIGSALEVPTGMGETALLWEVYKPEGVAVALRQRLKDAGVLASTAPAVDPEAGAGAGAVPKCSNCGCDIGPGEFHTAFHLGACYIDSASRVAASGGDGEGTGNGG